MLHVVCFLGDNVYEVSHRKEDWCNDDTDDDCYSRHEYWFEESSQDIYFVLQQITIEVSHFFCNLADISCLFTYVDDLDKDRVKEIWSFHRFYKWESSFEVIFDLQRFLFVEKVTKWIADKL